MLDPLGGKEGWTKLKEALTTNPKVDHWMASRNDKGETTLYVSTHSQNDAELVRPIQKLLPSGTLPPKTEQKEEKEFIRKHLEHWVTVGDKDDLYTQRRDRPGAGGSRQTIRRGAITDAAGITASIPQLPPSVPLRSSMSVGRLSSPNILKVGTSISGVPNAKPGSAGGQTYKGPMVGHWVGG